MQPSSTVCDVTQLLLDMHIGACDLCHMHLCDIGHMQLTYVNCIGQLTYDLNTGSRVARADRVRGVP